MLPQPHTSSEITDHQWRKMWENFKTDAKSVLGVLRTVVSRQFDLQFETKEWDALCPIVRYQPNLERITEASGPETGWIRNPTPLFETLIKAVAESNIAELIEMLEELDLLRKKADDIWTVG
jgi:hypothetical protein